MASKSPDFNLVREIALGMPGVAAGASIPSLSLTAQGKFFTCMAVHKSAEPNSLVLKLDFETRDRLIAAEPERYYLTDHYTANAVVLVRLAMMNRTALRSLLETAWQLASTAVSGRRRNARARKA